MMSDSILGYVDSVGFCSLIETTASRLFTHGCDAAADTETDDVWFSVSIPRTNSAEFATLRRVVDEHAGRSRSEPATATPMLIEIKSDENAVTNSDPQQQAKLAHTLANRFLRAYEHTYFDVLVPRHRLDGRTIVLITPEHHKRLDYTPVGLDLGDVLDSYLPSHVDVEGVHLSYLMGAPDRISPSWRILVDGARHFESGNLREAVLCACSAAEIMAAPKVEEWLTKSTLSHDLDAIRNAVRELGNPLRFELCIAGACVDAFSSVDRDLRTSLLAELRRMNSLRNAVVHRGTEPDAVAAASALRAAASFVCQMWLSQIDSVGS
jgi:hypothetical protein